MAAALIPSVRILLLLLLVLLLMLRGSGSAGSSHSRDRERRSFKPQKCVKMFSVKSSREVQHQRHVHVEGVNSQETVSIIVRELWGRRKSSVWSCVVAAPPSTVLRPRNLEAGSLHQKNLDQLVHSRGDHVIRRWRDLCVFVRPACCRRFPVVGLIKLSSSAVPSWLRFLVAVPGCGLTS